MSYKLFLDDMRKCPDGWVWAYNYAEFVRIITEQGTPDVIAFDHDLGEERDPDTDFLLEFQPTGYDCAKWVVNNNHVPKEFSVHSFNYSGAQRIKDLLKENGSIKVDSPFPYLNS